MIWLMHKFSFDFFGTNSMIEQKLVNIAKM